MQVQYSFFLCCFVWFLWSNHVKIVWYFELNVNGTLLCRWFDFFGRGSLIFTNSEYMFHLFYACLIHIEKTHKIMSHVKILLHKSLGLPLCLPTCYWNWARSNIRLIFDWCWGIIIAKNIARLNSSNFVKKWRTCLVESL